MIQVYQSSQKSPTDLILTAFTFWEFSCNCDWSHKKTHRSMGGVWRQGCII